MSATGKPLRVLLVEDNDWDARMAQEAFAASAPHVHLERVRDGVGALQRMREPVSEARPRPDMVLLDLNLPLMDGREVLRTMKGEATLLRTPVVVLTTSRAHTDIAMAYDLHANAYINKPFDEADYPAMVKAIEEFWQVWNVSPNEAA